MEAAYLSDRRYAALIEHLVDVLTTYKGTWWRKPQRKPADSHMALHSALRLGGVDMGDLSMNRTKHRVDPTKRLALVDALDAIEPSPFTGEFDPCRVKMALGEHGEVWPIECQEEV